MRKSFRTLGLLVCFVAGSGVAVAGAYDDILIASENGKTSVVIDLLERGMDVNTTDQDGSTLLLIASRGDNRRLVEALLSRRASVGKRNRFGDTAINVAALQGLADIVGVLISAGAEINASGWAPLHYAAYSGHLPVVEVLLTKGANPTLRAPNGRTALMLAAQNDHREVITALIRAGADVAAVDYAGKSYEAILGNVGGATEQRVYQKRP